MRGGPGWSRPAGRGGPAAAPAAVRWKGQALGPRDARAARRYLKPGPMPPCATLRAGRAAQEERSARHQAGARAATPVRGRRAHAICGHRSLARLWPTALNQWTSAEPPQDSGFQLWTPKVFVFLFYYIIIIAFFGGGIGKGESSAPPT